MAESNVVSIASPQSVVVSPEMTIVRGRGSLSPTSTPQDAFAIGFDVSSTSPTLSVVGSAGVGRFLNQATAAIRVVLLMSPNVVGRIDGHCTPDSDVEQVFHMPTELRSIALTLRDCERRGEAGEIYLAAKGIELVYETWSLLDSDGLTPMAGSSGLSRADSDRIVAARRLIEARWREKLSLDLLAAQCGLNREKLTRGFRQMFSCSVSEAIAERRLTEASRMLLTTDLPVSSVGYENGYCNNASFARAFGRRFGQSPSDFRSRRLAA